MPRLRGERTVSAVLLFGMALAVVVVLGLVAGGYSYKAAAERRSEAMAVTHGNPDLGPAAILLHGCGGCHTIPGVTGANGRIGPSLEDLARRVYIGGVLPNTPDNLIAWIVDPHAADAKTAMPATGISPEEARNVAAYLYSLP